MIDFPAWGANPWGEAGRNYHAHNRLLASVTASGEERRKVARMIAEKLAAAKGPTVYLSPNQGIEGWDREGEPMHAPDALAAFLDEARRAPVGGARRIELDAHINDEAFAQAALVVFDEWVKSGVVATGAS